MEKLIVVADLGRLRVFRMEYENIAEGMPARATEIEVPSLEEVPEPLHETVTDQAGRFSRGNIAESGMSHGEEHELERDLEKRLIHSLAEKIGTVVDTECNSTWILAAPKAICHRLEAALPSKAKDRLTYIEMVDLTKLPIKEIEERFRRF